MGLKETVKNRLGRLKSRIASGVEKSLAGPFSSKILRKVKSIPFIKKRIQKGYEGIMEELVSSLRPYKKKYTTYSRIPEEGRNIDEILKEMEELKSIEEPRWKDGFASGAVYHGDRDHIDFLDKVYALNSQSNPLHFDLWPSSSKFEAEIVTMTANLMSAAKIDAGDEPEKQICGVVSSGGTESILLAMKSYRDQAEEQKGITDPEMIVPSTAHAVFDKAGQYFKIKVIRIPVDEGFRADVEETGKAITRNTMVIVGSAPSFPHGIIDPIEDLSELARRNEIGFHTDACLGGFVLPWVKKLGYEVPPFDFELPGVTSISADTHRYGYAAKGTSVILYRGLDLRRYQFFKATDWSGGLYIAPTMTGSRPGALNSVCWAAMIAIGEKGYIKATSKIVETAKKVKKGIAEIPELEILGDPLWIIAFSSESLDIYKIMDCMAKKGWSLNGLHKPESIHLCVTLRHTKPGVAERFIGDLETSVDYVKKNPHFKGDLAPLYGMAASIPARNLVGDLLDSLMDMLYKP